MKSEQKGKPKPIKPIGLVRVFNVKDAIVFLKKQKEKIKFLGGYSDTFKRTTISENEFKYIKQKYADLDFFELAKNSKDISYKIRFDLINQREKNKIIRLVKYVLLLIDDLISHLNIFSKINNKIVQKNISKIYKK